MEACLELAEPILSQISLTEMSAGTTLADLN